MDATIGRKPEIMALLGKGLTPKQIAGQLGIGRCTVYTHIEKLKMQYHCNTISALQFKAYSIGVNKDYDT